MRAMKEKGMKVKEHQKNGKTKDASEVDDIIK